MMLKSKLAAVIGTTVLAGAVFASSQPHPLDCPSISAIQAEGITTGYEIMNNLYAGITSSHFDTPFNWIFLIGPLEAESEDDAIDIGNQYLSAVSGNPTPEMDKGAWVCEYESGEPELGAVAVQSDEFISPLQFKQFLKK